MLLGFGVLAVAWQIPVAIIALGLIGIGLGAINTPLLLIIGEFAPVGTYGRAIGIYQLIGDIGGSLGPIIGLEALIRFGGMVTLVVLSAFMGLMVPLAASLWRHERAEG